MYKFELLCPECGSYFVEHDDNHIFPGEIGELRCSNEDCGALYTMTLTEGHR